MEGLKQQILVKRQSVACKTCVKHKLIRVKIVEFVFQTCNLLQGFFSFVLKRWINAMKYIMPALLLWY
jgi:hypothetical protein